MCVCLHTWYQIKYALNQSEFNFPLYEYGKIGYVQGILLDLSKVVHTRINDTHIHTRARTHTDLSHIECDSAERKN